ncbi:hypothetical protein [Dongshaea marina]|uniref:hypothetical protein n=1 Tax=Dongshaea marina TaxID=2047966 RepID=UPI000D3EBB76|nr:hypothetical protein [Dongshaea marina]
MINADWGKLDQKYIEVDGVPQLARDIFEWAQYFEKEDRFTYQSVVGPFRVSTAFLGLDYGYGMTEKPLIYETMIYGLWLNCHLVGHASMREEAIEAHTQGLFIVFGGAEKMRRSRTWRRFKKRWKPGISYQGSCRKWFSKEYHRLKGS